MFILTFDVESAYALNLQLIIRWKLVSLVGRNFDQYDTITRVLKRNKAPATFFILGKVFESANWDLADLLNSDILFDIGSHTYSHMGILGPNTEAIWNIETYPKIFRQRAAWILRSRRILQRITRGHPKQLEIIWNHGHRFLSPRS